MKKDSWQAPYPSWTCSDCPAHRSGLFSDLKADQLRDLEKGRVLEQFQRGQILYYEGHHPMAAFCVLTGQIKIYKTLRNGRHRILHLAGPGDILGHESLLKKDTYQSTAEAMEASHVCVLPRCVVLPIFEKNPKVLLRLLDKATEDLQKLENSTAANLSYRSVSARMAALLLDLNQRFGHPVHWGSSIELPLSRAEIGSMLGTTTETTIRILSRLQSQGILALGQHSIDLKNIAALEALIR